jgi:phosphate transport system ATP-binding protein
MIANQRWVLPFYSKIKGETFMGVTVVMERPHMNTLRETAKKETVYNTNQLNVWYGEHHALKNINLSFYENEITAIIGPSGCGKSTYIKTLNRMIELSPNVRITGEVSYRGRNIFDSSYHLEELRTSVGMVFQKPNPFPKSIYDNVAYGPRIHGVRNKSTLDAIVEKSLRAAALWDEVKDRLHEHAHMLSGGQQQRLCIARCLAVEPDVILMDEPTSALDPVSTAKIEELMQQLKEHYSIIIVTHNMQQAVRISDKTAFFLNGEVIEFGDTRQLFSNPRDKRTEDYITGRFG